MFVPLYKALVRSHFDYAASVWAPCTAKLRDQIEAVQRRATKFLPGMKDLEYPERLKKLGLTTLAHRRHRSDVIEMYKICHEVYDKDISIRIKFSREGSSRELRGHNFKIKKLSCDTRLRSTFFTYRTVNVWNSLPKQVAEAPSLNAFKARLDKFWSTQSVLYDYKADVYTMPRPGS